MDGDNRNDRVKEWEDGLPSVAELTPLSQCLISPQLASAFSITSDIPPYHILADVNKASQSIVAILRGTHTSDSPSPNNPNNLPFNLNPRNSSNSNPHSLSPNYPVNPNFPKSRNPNPNLPVVTSGDVNDDESRYPFDRSVHTRIDPGHDQDQDRDQDRDQDHDPQPEEVDSSVPEEANPNDDSSARTLKRPRLVWTPELHKRFIEAVGHLGIHNAVPKTIMQLMNVEGLTRENVASHLQKYRLYLKRMQGLSSEGPSSSDYIFASAPMPPGYYAGMEDVVKSSIKTLAPQGAHPMVRGSNPTTPAIEPYPYNVFAPPPQRFIRPDPHHMHGTTRQQIQNPNPHHVLRSFPTGK